VFDDRAAASEGARAIAALLPSLNPLSFLRLYWNAFNNEDAFVLAGALPAMLWVSHDPQPGRELHGAVRPGGHPGMLQKPSEPQPVVPKRRP